MELANRIVFENFLITRLPRLDCLPSPRRLTFRFAKLVKRSKRQYRVYRFRNRVSTLFSNFLHRRKVGGQINTAPAEMAAHSTPQAGPPAERPASQRFGPPGASLTGQSQESSNSASVAFAGTTADLNREQGPSS